MNIERGDILFVDLEPVKGSEQGNKRPCLVVQNDIRNKFAPTTIIVPITTRLPDKEYPTSVIVDPSESGLKEKSAVLCYQIRTISVQNRVIKRIGRLASNTMEKVNEALKATLALG
ncbi:type II toxin-antitoxin system PemK/MazF family toxin [Candidatus Micrarchaeota archaeon]|nr:type II toxin-antitoxin system PemK/MazF family toxin [Candidatus Micrarchaeota archaeon]